MKAFQLLPAIVLAVALTNVAQSAQQSGREPELDAGGAALTKGQQLVNQFVADHAELAALELALTTQDGCKTVAASAREDVGEACDADELGPIRTGKAEVEEPTEEDPLYDVTQALHDSHGNPVGAVGMDLRPTIGSRDQVVERAKELLHDLEAQIPSNAWISEAVGR